MERVTLVTWLCGCGKSVKSYVPQDWLFHHMHIIRYWMNGFHILCFHILTLMAEILGYTRFSFDSKHFQDHTTFGYIGSRHWLLYFEYNTLYIISFLNLYKIFMMTFMIFPYNWFSNILLFWQILPIDPYFNNGPFIHFYWWLMRLW